jgi:all-trans-8'-apo-beta-carotenal 15,15'-oxygenase
MLKVEFHDGKVYGKYKMVQTPAYKRDLKQKNFWRQNVIWSIVKKKIGLGEEYNSVNNSASTSILRVPNSEKYYALYEGGLAYRMEEKTMNEEDFDDFGFVQKGFSAHPKIDPDNGDIFNIGFNIGTCDLYRMSKDLKLICKNSFKTRIKQSIHDCCLAGDYFVVFECPISMNMWKFAKGYPSLNCYAFDYQDGKTIAYIYKKDTLEFVKRIELSSPEPFMMYHFTNGYM